MGSLIAAHVRAVDSRVDERELIKTLTALTVKVDSLTTDVAALKQQLQQSDLRQRDIETKVTRIMSYGGAGITIVTLLVHFLGK